MNRLDKAVRALASARLLFKTEDPDGAVDRAYYAATSALRAYGQAEGETAPKTHAGLISGFGRYLVQDRGWNPDLGRDLNEVERLRIGADYWLDRVELAKAAWAIEAASEFIEAIKTALSAKG